MTKAEIKMSNWKFKFYVQNKVDSEISAFDYLSLNIAPQNDLFLISKVFPHRKLKFKGDLRILLACSQILQLFKFILGKSVQQRIILCKQCIVRDIR